MFPHHVNTINLVDTHAALVALADDGEQDTIVLEPTPRFYSQHPTWVYATLKRL